MRHFAIIALLAACTGPAAEAPTPNNAETPKEPAAASQPAAEPPKSMAFTPLEGAKVMFVEPADGAEVGTTFAVKMGVEGATVKPAGEVVAGTGHHHIIVDGEGVPAGTAVAKDETHIHYGDGSTETELTLEPGEHTLTLQFADGMHRSYGPDLSQTITITVK